MKYHTALLALTFALFHSRFLYSIIRPMSGTLPAITQLSFAAFGDSLDWKDYDAGTIFDRVTTRVAPGSIVLFHNAALHTPEALPNIVEHLIHEGYTIVPISELILDGDYMMDHTGRQCPCEAE